MSPRTSACLLSLSCAAPTAALAAGVGAGETAAAIPDLGASALQMVFGLLVVLGLLLGALWLLKRIGQPRGAAAGLLRVVAGVAVGPRERVVILELGESWLVLGVAPGQVSTLAEIPRREMPEAPTPRDFVALLAERLRKNA